MLNNKKKSRIQNINTEKPYNVEKLTKVLHKKRLYKVIPVFKVGDGTMGFSSFLLLRGIFQIVHTML